MPGWKQVKLIDSVAPLGLTVADVVRSDLFK